MINVPTNISEQQRIGTALLGIDQYIFALERDSRKQESIRRGLMHDLLTGQVRVKILEAVAA